MNSAHGRHDVIHLLTDLPRTSFPLPRCSSPESSSSWDSLPSDEGETFGISDQEEVEEYERRKKQAWIDALREERLRERKKEDEAMDPPAVLDWNVDEEVSYIGFAGLKSAA